MKSMLLVALLGAGCARAPTPLPTDPAALRVLVPGSASIHGVAWHGQSSVVVSLGTEQGARLFEVDADSGSMTPRTEPPKSSACDGTDQLSPVGSDRGLEWLQVCKHASEPRHYSLMQESTKGDVTVQRTFDTPFPVGGFTFDGKDWIADYGSRICNTLIRFTETGLEPIHVTVESPDGNFNTGGDVRDNCDRMGVSRAPAVRAGRLAFLASTTSIKNSGTGRLLQPSDIYIAPVAGGQAERIAVGLVSPGDVLWIDDSHVVVTGELPAGSPGTWLVDIDSGNVKSLLAFAARSISLSPDGTEVVAMRAVAAPSLDLEIVAFPASVLGL